MSVKDHVEEYKTLLKDFGDIFLEHFEKGRENGIECNKKILVCGMGGSAISGDYLKKILLAETNIQVEVSKSYIPPNYVSDQWSVFAISYSGNTEETITQVLSLLEKGIKPTIITSGGKLEQIAHQENLKILKVKKGLQPRAALPNLFGILLGSIYDSLNIDLNIKRVGESIKNYCKNLMESEKFIDNLSSSVVGKTIFILTPSILSAVGLRFRCQLNENSKHHAASFESPEFSHNAIIGFDGKYSQNIFLVLIRTNLEDNRTKIHLNFIEDLGKNKCPIVSFQGEGENLLEQMLSLTVFLDLFSVILAEKQEIDPYEIVSINELKAILKSN